MLKRERDKASKRQAKKSGNRETASQARLALALKALTGKLSSKPNRKPPDDLEYHRRLNVKLAELKAKHWDWTREQLIKEAERLIFALDPHHG